MSMSPNHVVKRGFFDFYDAVMKVRLAAEALAAEDKDPIGRMPKRASDLLMVAWMDCISLEAEADLKNHQDLMNQAKQRSYAIHRNTVDNATAVFLGGPAMVVKALGREYPAPAYIMAGARPLWWVYAQEIKDGAQSGDGNVG